MVKIRVMHIWDQCENSCLISENLIKKGHQSFVIKRRKYCNIADNAAKYSFNKIVNGGPITFLLTIIFYLLTFRPHLVHINSWDKGVILTKIFAPYAKIIMHYHGSEIRGKEVPLTVQLFTNVISVSTNDLMGVGLSEPFWPRLLPVIVSDDFYYRGGREKGAIIELIPETKNIPHELMPFILSLGEFYRDTKRIPKNTPTLLSKIAMEAIKCGTKILLDTGEIVETFPMAELNDYWKLYNEVCCIYPSL